MIMLCKCMHCLYKSFACEHFLTALFWAICGHDCNHADEFPGCIFYYVDVLSCIIAVERQGHLRVVY